MKIIPGRWLVVSFAPKFVFIAGFETKDEAVVFVLEELDDTEHEVQDYVAVIEANTLFSNED